MAKYRIKGKCDKCGPFTVYRPKRRRQLSDGSVAYRPQNIVCHRCKMWAEIVTCEELA